MSPQLVVADLQRALDFYTRQLGFKIDFLYEDFYAAIGIDGYTIHLKLGKATARAYSLKNEDLDLVFSVENIDQLFEALQSRQEVIIQQLRQMPYGREFYIADPDGYILGFVEAEQAVN